MRRVEGFRFAVNCIVRSALACVSAFDVLG